MTIVVLVVEDKSKRRLVFNDTTEIITTLRQYMAIDLNAISSDSFLDRFYRTSSHEAIQITNSTNEE